MAQPLVAWGSLVRTGLHFEPFSPSVKCGGPEAIAAVMFYDSGDELSACMTDTFWVLSPCFRFAGDGMGHPTLLHTGHLLIGAS